MSTNTKKPRTTKRVTASKKQSKFRLKKPRSIKRLQTLRQRRAHKSFRLTRRRDYRRGLVLPGYFALTAEAFSHLRRHKRLIFVMLAVFSALTLLLGGLSSHQSYTQLQQLFIGEDTEWSFAAQVGLLAVASLSGLSTSLTEVQQVYVGFMIIMTWLTMVWLLREFFAGNSPRFRDGLYNSGAPIIPTVLLALILLVQLLPLGLLALAYSALQQVGILTEGFGMLLFSAIGVCVAALTLYWTTSTAMALVIVTLPGMYPWKAMHAASDIVVGRRLRLMYRLLWATMLTAIGWLLIMLPMILLDQWIVSSVTIALPSIIPSLAVVLFVASTIWMSTYIYTLYRKVVAYDAEQRG